MPRARLIRNYFSSDELYVHQTDNGKMNHCVIISHRYNAEKMFDLMLDC